MPGPDPRRVVPPVAWPRVPAHACGNSAPRGRPSGQRIPALENPSNDQGKSGGSVL